MAMDVLELLSLVILQELGSLTYFKNPDLPFLLAPIYVQIKIIVVVKLCVINSKEYCFRSFK